MQEQFDQNQDNKDNQINDTDRPVSFSQPQKSERKQVSTWLGVLIILLTTALLFGGVFVLQYYLKSQILINQAAGNISKTADWFEIKEAGLKFKISDDIKDLIYEVQVNNNDLTTITFSTKTLKKSCTVSGPTLGGIDILYEAPIANSFHYPKKPLLQHDDLYIYFIHPQATCSDNQDINSLQIKQLQSLQNSLKTIEKITADQTNNEEQNETVASKLMESCGPNFNNAYKDTAEKRLTPDFCFNLKTIGVDYKTDIKGYKYCTAFNGHTFRASNWIDPSNKDLKQNFFHLSSTIFPTKYNNETNPVTTGDCIESYSVYTKKIYCDMLQQERDKDRCFVFLAYYYNDISICEKTSAPSMNDQANQYNTARYTCYSNVAERSKNDAYCDLIPKGTSIASDMMNQNCHEFVKTRTVNKQ